MAECKYHRCGFHLTETITKRIKTQHLFLSQSLSVIESVRTFFIVGQSQFIFGLLFRCSCCAWRRWFCRLQSNGRFQISSSLFCHFAVPFRSRRDAVFSIKLPTHSTEAQTVDYGGFLLKIERKSRKERGIIANNAASVSDVWLMNERTN